MAASNQISAGHAQALRSFDAATRALKLQHGKAKDALADADRARDTLAPERTRPGAWSPSRRNCCAGWGPSAPATPTAPASSTPAPPPATRGSPCSSPTRRSASRTSGAVRDRDRTTAQD
ncbi:hypothetical protein ACFQX6_09830 [Streptosporangium lutulentum]